MEPINCLHKLIEVSEAFATDCDTKDKVELIKQANKVQTTCNQAIKHCPDPVMLQTIIELGSKLRRMKAQSEDTPLELTAIVELKTFIAQIKGWAESELFRQGVAASSADETLLPSNISEIKHAFSGINQQIPKMAVRNISKESIEGLDFPIDFTCPNNYEIDLRNIYHVTFWAEAANLKNRLNSRETQMLIELTEEFSDIYNKYEELATQFLENAEYKELARKIIPKFRQKVSEADLLAPVSKELVDLYQSVQRSFNSLVAARERLVTQMDEMQRGSFEAFQKSSDGAALSDLEETVPLEDRKSLGGKDREWMQTLFSNLLHAIDNRIHAVDGNPRARKALHDRFQKMLKESPDEFITEYLKRVISGDYEREEEKEFALWLVNYLGGESNVFHKDHLHTSFGPFHVSEEAKHGVLKSAAAKELFNNFKDFMKASIKELKQI